MSTHVALFFEELLQVQLHREVAERLPIDDEHRLEEHQTLLLVDVEHLPLHVFFLGFDIDAQLDRTFFIASVVEVKVHFDTFLALFLGLFVFLGSKLLVEDLIRVIHVRVGAVDVQIVHADRLVVLSQLDIKHVRRLLVQVMHHDQVCLLYTSPSPRDRG